MKKIINQLLLLASLVVVFSSCKKDENQVVFEGGTNPVLSSNRTATIPLTYNTRTEEAITLAWTNPEYQFNTGISSQNVSYTVEIDTIGANFTSANKKSISIGKDLSLTYTQEQLNTLLFTPANPTATYNLEIRVISSLFNSTVKLYSNTLSLFAAPYIVPPKVVPPGTAPDYLDGHLYIVGNATPGDWSNPVPVPSQEFTRLSATDYEIIIPLIANNSYLLLPVNGSWSAKYGGLGGNNTNNVDGDDFKAGGGDLKAPATSGLYKIVVDFQRGKFTVTHQ